MKKYVHFLLLISITMGLQALSYYSLKLFLTDYNLIHSFINIPFNKFFIYFYNTWYPFIFISALLIYKKHQKVFDNMIIVMILSALLANITFIIFPSIVERPAIEVHGLTDWIVNYTYTMDTPASNCFPSMHCIYCFIMIYFILKCKDIKPIHSIGIVIYSFIIILSTLFTKQHIIEDVISAYLYTLFSIFIVELVIEKLSNKNYQLSLDNKKIFLKRNKKN